LTRFINQDTVLVMDETHRAASLKSATSQFFLDVIDQTNLINFQSASAIKKPENLEFFHKLFPRSVSRNDLQKVIENADGKISRTLPFKPLCQLKRKLRNFTITQMFFLTS
jgi:hypothetical protein